jgi:hypothetical protein
MKRMRVKQGLGASRNALRQLFFQRCFYLFTTLLAMILLAPFIEDTHAGVLTRNVINVFVVLSAVAAVGRSLVSFLTVLILALPALVLRWQSVSSENPGHVDLALGFDVAVYATAIALLLRYVFDREVMTSDRLWGAASAYLMIGLLWSFLFAIVDRIQPGSFAVRGEIGMLALHDLIYFSFSSLTTTGFGDIVPVGRIAKTAATLQVIIGQLFIAILIAKLVGVYPAALHEKKVEELDSSESEDGKGIRTISRPKGEAIA